MTGTSMDGIDISLVQTNGLDLRRLNKNYFYKYSAKTKKNLLNVLKEDHNFSFERRKFLDDFITNFNVILNKNQRGAVKVNIFRFMHILINF